MPLPSATRSLTHLQAPAKVNAFLHITGRRADGYHLLQSVFFMVDWADEIHLECRPDGRIQRHDLGEPLPADDLCLRAARLLQSESQTALGVDVSIFKQVPWGAGLGGGSSDAATVLMGLNRLWDLNWPRSRLIELGLQLGADVPFFIGGRSAWVEGVGEWLSPLSLPSTRLAILKPAVNVPTAQVFQHPLLHRDSIPATVTDFPTDANWLQTVLSKGAWHNDMQDAAQAICPEISQAAALLAKQWGSARMTGSGSAVFAALPAQAASTESTGGTGACPEGLDLAGLWPGTLESGWQGKICQSLDTHPLQGWLND